VNIVKRIVVIGAGPAGSAAAMSLARVGAAEVLLLDRASFPRTKVCGSGLSPWTLELLDRMGMGRAVRQEAYLIRAGVIGSAGGRTVELRSRYEAAILLRERFDTLLVQEAVGRGARLYEGARVDAVLREQGRVLGVDTTLGKIEADAVIVANGAMSKLDSRPRRGHILYTILGWYTGVSGISDAVELYFDPAVRPHYGWVFPESAERVNIGICYIPERGGPTARQRFEAFLHRRLSGRLGAATRIGKLVGHPVATGYRPRELSSAGMLIAGEAAHLVDPSTAEGIYYALASGMLAGEFMGDLVQRGEPFSDQQLLPYTDLVRKQLGGRLLAGQLLLGASRTPALDIALRFGSFKPTQAFLTWALARA
jgi:geranylgeranyl reductase family protein